MSTLSDRFGITKTGSSWGDITDKPATFTPSEHNHDGVYLPVAGQAADSAQLAGLAVSSFLRSNAINVIASTSILQRDGQVAPTYNNGHMEFRTTDANDVSIGFHRSGFTACQLRHESNGLILSGTDRTTAANFYAYGNITAYSDRRLKKNIEHIEDALWKVRQLSGYTFERTNEDPSEVGKRHTGVIAQEVEAVLPEAVMTGSDGKLAVAYGNMVGLLIEAVKELSSKVDCLESRA